MRGKNVGGIVEDKRVIVGGVASKECAVDKVGKETDATERLEDQTTISALKRQEVRHFFCLNCFRTGLKINSSDVSLYQSIHFRLRRLNRCR